MRRPQFIVAWAVLLPASLAAQDDDRGYRQLPEAQEIALARSAAPEAVSADATIWVIRDGRFEVAVHGSNPNHCFVQRSTAQSLEPICYDAEGAATVLLWEFEHFALRTSGLSSEELEKALSEAVGSGRIPIPSRPAMSYMQSSGQHLFDAESGRDAGNWRPHLMLYVPFLTNEDVGLPGASSSLSVARPGTPLAHVIVVVPDFVDPITP